MQNTSNFIKQAEKWAPDKISSKKIDIQARKRKLEILKKDTQAKIDGLAIQLDALSNISGGFNINESNDYKCRLTVTDHALVRYIDRVLKIDMEAYRQQLIDSLPDTVPLNASILTHNKTILQLTWLPKEVILKTLYKGKGKKKR